jgi:hypothetical protein
VSDLYGERYCSVLVGIDKSKYMLKHLSRGVRGYFEKYLPKGVDKWEIMLQNGEEWWEVGECGNIPPM